MKRALILFLFFVPSLGFAKYCPACLQTYQSQTIGGQAKVVYQWMTRIMSDKMPLSFSDTEHLFNKNSTITINGKRVATFTNGIYKFFNSAKEHQKIIEAQLQQVIVNGDNAVLKYQFVSKRKNNPEAKYRTIAMMMLHFKHHKVQSWWEIQYTKKITN